ncbi:hypothetical protein KY289_033772 [Solanum tuberosum]|nr:hypothetical protein KY289_033772 [Solanum tuberosum]
MKLPPQGAFDELRRTMKEREGNQDLDSRPYDSNVKSTEGRRRREIAPPGCDKDEHRLLVERVKLRGSEEDDADYTRVSRTAGSRVAGLPDMGSSSRGPLDFARFWAAAGGSSFSSLKKMVYRGRLVLFDVLEWAGN